MVEFNAGHWVKLSTEFETHGKSRLLDLIKNFHKDNSIDLTTSSI